MIEDNYSDKEPLLKKPGIGQVGALYSIVVLLFIMVGYRVQRGEFNTGILITEFGLIMLPAIIFLTLWKFDIKRILRLNKVSLLNLFLVLCIMVFALPAVGVLNLANLWLINTIFGRVSVMQPPVGTDTAGLIVSILVIGGSAGICEELLFRGVIMRGLERLGIVKAILITSLLFGLLHLDFQKLLGTFLLGALIGFIVYRTNSIFAGMFAHFTNNTIAVLISYVSSRLFEIMGSSVTEQYNQAGDLFSSLQNMPGEQLVITIIVWVMMFLSCAAVLSGLFIAFIRTTSERVEKIPDEPRSKNKAQVLWYLPGLALIGLIYFANGINLAGAKNILVDSILKVIGAL